MFRKDAWYYFSFLKFIEFFFVCVCGPTWMWSILENVPCALEKVYSSAFGWNVLNISMRSIASNVLFKTCVSFLIFCFDDLSIGVSGVLKYPTITVLLSISPFMPVSVCHVLRCSSGGCIVIYNCYVFLLHWSFDQLCIVLPHLL